MLSWSAFGQGEAFYVLSPDRQTVVLWSAVQYLREDIGKVNEALKEIAVALAETREALAEMRGRQNATTGVAAGVPASLAGVLVWWIRKSKKEEGKEHALDKPSEGKEKS